MREIVFDTETTGLNPFGGDRMVEIGCVEVFNRVETGGGEVFDKVIVVSAPSDVQRQRVLGRAGMSEEKFEALLARQMPDEEKRAKADFVVDTGGDLSTTERQVGDVLACLGLAGGG